MGTLCTPQRWEAEKMVLARKASDFRAHESGGTTRVEGWHRATSGNRYKLQIPDLRGFPVSAPDLYIASPQTLPRYDGGTINDEGATHHFHTSRNGPDGCVRICHYSSWDATKTVWSVLFIGILWLTAYEIYRATGRYISDIVDELKKVHESCG